MPNPEMQREFAVDVVSRLRSAGFEAVWAGGCVRDSLLGKTPKDFDVATNAHPDQIRELFGQRRTIAIGAAFGVITVLGNQDAGQIEVATFRKDAEYLDGRHPQSVSFTNAEQDALRRDFTINALFFDPIESRVIDYVGGVKDLESKIVRAVGDPDARIDEDKLRMLRAIRFAARFEFALDDATLKAVARHAHELVIVSAERIASEMRFMLGDSHRQRAVELLMISGLLEVILPKAAKLCANESAWDSTLQVLGELVTNDFATGLAALIYAHPDAESLPVEIASRWRLSNDELEQCDFLVRNWSTIIDADRLAWSKIQPILIRESAVELVSLARAIAHVSRRNMVGVEFCEAKLRLARPELDPPSLIHGGDLKSLGVPVGPAFKFLLQAARDAQLDSLISSKDEAKRLVLARFAELNPDSLH
jgi:poly(A) polymerase